MSTRRADIAACYGWPRALGREEAAAYVGVSPTHFDRFIGNVLPGPFSIGGRKLWDRKALDLAIDRLSGRPQLDVNDAVAKLDKRFGL
jgi:hypothetical protein